MELDFDKEIDALLRQKDFSPPATGAPEAEHLGPDEISAFADNSLPDASRVNYTRHVALCDQCRKILSSVIALNAESAAKADVSPAPVAEIAAASWFSGLFRFPGLVYAMAGLTIIFAGFLVFSVMRSAGDGAADVSQVSVVQQQPATGGPSVSDEQLLPTYSANTSTNTNATAVAKEVPAANTANTSEKAEAASTLGNPTTAKRPVEQMKGAPAMPGAFSVGGAPAAPPPGAADSVAAQTERKELKESERSDQAFSLQKLEPGAGTAGTVQEDRVNARAKRRADAQSKIITGPSQNLNMQTQQNSSNNSIALSGRRMIAGRNFELKQGVWYDSTYSGQPTANLRRGTDAYKAADAGLRSIGGALGGTVVVVWKGRAYRID